MQKPVFLQEIEGGVCAPRGFEAGGIYCGVVDNPEQRPDLAVIFSREPAVSAAVFTTNRVQAAPVLLCREHLKDSQARAIVVNSRNANACTGEAGKRHARQMAEATAQALEVRAEEVFVCSTGHIGHLLPIERIVEGIPQAVADLGGDAAASSRAATAIMTSDDYQKEIAVEYQTPDGPARIGAIAKGAGMIDPNMATMLCFITTDLAVNRKDLQSALATAVENTFNRIIVDGDCSTNDTVIALSNGAAGGGVLSSSATQEFQQFQQALEHVCRRLARMIVEDGEGATRTIDLHIRNAATPQDARKAGRAVARSQLVKTSWCGGDPNWGRLMDALGYSGAEFDPEKVDIFYQETQAVKQGESAGASLELLREIAAKRRFQITIDLNAGSEGYSLYTTDLSSEYVNFNLKE